MLVMSGGTRGSSASAPRVTSTGVSLDQIALRDLDDSSCRILVRAQWGRVLQFHVLRPGEDAVSWCSVDQPWRCLWRRFSQITMTRPLRRITLHLSQIFLTLG